MVHMQGYPQGLFQHGLPTTDTVNTHTYIGALSIHKCKRGMQCVYVRGEEAIGGDCVSLLHPRHGVQRHAGAKHTCTHIRTQHYLECV